MEVSFETQTLSGPCARRGAPFAVLESDAVHLHCQLDSGLDISHITGTRRPFHCRSVPGAVADGEYVRASLGTLYHALGVLPAWNSTTLPGFDPRTGLHAGLSGLTTAHTVREMTFARGKGVAVNYDIGPGITGNYFSQVITAKRLVMLYDEPLGDNPCVIVARDDVFELQRECHFGHLEHPNFVIRPGDHLCTNLDALKCLYDRDGVTPLGQNPFSGFDPAILSLCLPERCFFLYVEPVKPLGGGDPVVPMLLLGQDGTGLGFTSSQSAEMPSWVMCWFSPMSNNYGEGVGSIEFGTLPVGPERAIALGLMPKLPAGTAVRRTTRIYLLDTTELVDAFARRFDIRADPSFYPARINPDGPLSLYDQEVATFPSLRTAAGLSL